MNWQLWKIEKDKPKVVACSGVDDLWLTLQMASRYGTNPAGSYVLSEVAEIG